MKCGSAMLRRKGTSQLTLMGVVLEPEWQVNMLSGSILT